MTNPISIVDKSKFKEKLNQEDIWDSIANPWKVYVVKEIPIVKEFLENKKGKIVDFGCGNGRNFIENKNIEYYGIDFSKIQLKHAKRRIAQKKLNAKLFKGTVDKLDKKVFKDNFFDYGLFVSTLHCLETEKERENSLKEFNRVLKKNAIALISVWNKEDKRFFGHEKDIYMSWSEDKVPYFRYYYLFDKKELISLLKKTGFKIIEILKPREHDRFSKKNLVLVVKKLK